MLELTASSMPLISTYIFCVIHTSSRTWAENEYLLKQFLDDYGFIPILQISATGLYTKEIVNRLNLETVWIDTIDTLDPGCHNKIRYDDVINSSKDYEEIPFVVLFSIMYSTQI